MRLTYKYEKGSGYGSVKLKNLPNDPFVDKLPYLDDAWQEQRNKLGQLEDIEEELGIEIITLYKAIKFGFYFKDDFGDIGYISGNIIKQLNKENYRELIKVISDYGKTWALTKEELL